MGIKTCPRQQCRHYTNRNACDSGVASHPCWHWDSPGLGQAQDASSPPVLRCASMKHWHLAAFSTFPPATRLSQVRCRVLAGGTCCCVCVVFPAQAVLSGSAELSQRVVVIRFLMLLSHSRTEKDLYNVASLFCLLRCKTAGTVNFLTGRCRGLEKLSLIFVLLVHR